MAARDGSQAMETEKEKRKETKREKEKDITLSHWTTGSCPLFPH